MENDNDKLFNEMSSTSKNKKILLLMKNILIDYVLSFLDMLLCDININDIKNLDDININKELLSFNDMINDFNKEIEKSIELYNKDKNE